MSLRMWKRKPLGRPKGQKDHLSIHPMKISDELKELLFAEIKRDPTGRPEETLSDCALRLIRDRGKNVVALRKELDYMIEEKKRLKNLALWRSTNG